MPVLSNAKWERFAQELAKGKTADEAYELAGYAANRGNAARLKANESILSRISELLGRSAQKAELSIVTATEALLRISAKAESLGDASGLNVAKSAWMDACKVNGLIVDKKEIGRPGDFERMSEDELDAFIASRKAAVGGSDSREEPQGREEGVRKPSGLH